jgi:peptidoglycan-N-acetylglucosamine deacetylase
MSAKPIASLSLDLDNKWSYLKTHGDPGWQTFPTYLPLVVPRILRFFEERELTITVFIVGQDAVLEPNQAAIASLAAAGHEIANHSFHHDPWLHLYSSEEIEAELSRAEDAIERVTGQVPIGFRGPGFSCSPTTLRTLAARGYLYDASTFPTFLGPLARMYYFMTSNLSAQEKNQRKILFGTLGEGFRPIKPYRWPMDGKDLLEIPVTTVPFFRVPFHISYLLYLSTFSPRLAIAYFRTALWLCRVTGTPPSVLLHPLDFLGADDVSELSFFPAMNLPAERKLRVVSEAIGLLTKHFRVLTMHEHAREAGRRLGVPVVERDPSLQTSATAQLC